MQWWWMLLPFALSGLILYDPTMVYHLSLHAAALTVSIPIRIAVGCVIFRSIFFLYEYLYPEGNCGWLNWWDVFCQTKLIPKFEGIFVERRRDSPEDDKIASLLVFTDTYCSIVMSVKTERRLESFQGTRVYVVNPEQLRQKVVLQALQVGKPGKPDGLSPTASPPATQSFHDRKPRKRRLESDEGVFEDEDDISYSKISVKEVTTRAGRVSKVKQPGLVAKAPKPACSETSGLKVKKREPASVFRCPTCSKVYIGYSKLKLHFRKFPDHYNYSGQDATVSQDGQGKSAVNEPVHAETQTDSPMWAHGAEVGVQTSPPPSIKLSDSIDGSPNFPAFHSLLQSAASTDLQLNFPYSTGSTSGFLRAFTNLVAPNKQGNAIYTSPCNPGGHDSVVPPSPTPFSSPSPVSISSMVGNKTDSVPTPNSPTIGRFIGHGGGGSSTDANHSIGTIQKFLWELVEERMIQHGINEILAELADVAEKLAKIARDKIIPIREEEEEQLRANNIAPIVQVDTPFLSHLLDLPFGTYMFKEDAGVRRAPPPPVPADISLNSLTSGVEVDIDKFLPGIDLVHLPHLTNLDFSSI